MITWSLKIIKSNFFTVLILLLTAAVGRAIQLGALGEVSKMTYVLLEIPVEGSRILLLLLLMGNGSLKEGFGRAKIILTMKKAQWDQAGATMMRGLKEHYKALLIWLVVWLVSVFIFNQLITNISNDQNVLSGINRFPYLSLSFNATALTLLLKNLTVIPLTLFFEVWIFFKILYRA